MERADALEQRHNGRLGDVAHLRVGIFEIGYQLRHVTLKGQTVVLVHLDEPGHGRLLCARVGAANGSVDTGVNIRVAVRVQLEQQH